MQRKDFILNDCSRRVKLEEEVDKKIRPSFRTLFYGLKRNHPHNVAILHPLAFILRRVLYSIIIVFMAREDSLVFFGVLLLLFTCLFFGVLLLLEGSWEDGLIGQ